MPEVTTTPRGNDPQAYKDNSLALTNESAQVRMWRTRIERHGALLQIQARYKEAKKGDTYLDGTVDVKGQKLYMRYLLPLMEDLHRKTLPAIPTPRVEARGERGELFEDQARQLLDIQFNAPYSTIKRVCNALQWDDSRSGVGWAKTVWNVRTEEGNADVPQDPEQLAPEVERAQAENADPESAKLTERDVDYVHAQIHFEGAEAMPEGPGRDALLAHAEDHAAAMTEVRREGPELERVPWDRFVYDTDVVWEKRRWEAEMQTPRVQELLDAGFKNINPHNLPPEVKAGEDKSVAFEDRTCSVWHIHDRVNGKWFVISANGPIDGLFLHKAVWPYGTIDIYHPLVMRPQTPDQVRGAATIQVALPILERLAHIDFHNDRHIKSHADYKMGCPAGMDSAIKAGLGNPDQRFVSAGSPETWALMKEIKPPPLPTGNLQQREMLLGELRRAIGADAQDTAAPNPHQITATESGERAQAKSDRRTTRQETMGEFLGQIAKNFLMLFKEFATQDVLVRVLGPMGAAYKEINPADVPDDLDVYLDIKGESEDAKTEAIQSAHMANEFIATGAYPVDMQKWGEWYLRKLGVMRPEQFRLDTPQVAPGQEQDVPGTPGMASDKPPQGGQGQGGQTLQFPQQTQVA